ncbi:nucleotidyl transferase AbiEii/AbiGii toxin family protein [Lentisphaera profundi]|uniref:Nucleotidyl transferase AbiEii/AbiGii toxin family protein n=1 Tax=Lentisphaera profundi TaxID=1658616 RepID=A0ABY7VTM4_9BACT|nr:nucleotidyl transferase AbiEii/AbiGii toxin family protein [Lentisphaera profundi]WDE97548.1 nucleotidyl transferase AbiEii/AbiGii toxin family protein [Lentisphaera profundi]
MEIQQDFRDLLHLFNEQKVKYLVVGGYALAFHGAPRFTGDIDIWVRTSSENADKIINALNEFGFGALGITKQDLTQDDQVLQLGYPPIRIDIMTSIDGVDFDEAFNNSLLTSYGDIKIKIISKDDFIKNKRATGRYKDLADIEALGEL